MRLRRKLQTLITIATGKKTVIRALTEEVIEEFVKQELNCIGFSSYQLLILDAGGSRKGVGSASVFVGLLHHSKKKVISVNIDSFTNPHIVGDLCSSWPFKPQVFDIVIGTWVLEHLRKPEFFFQEAYRVLKSSGILILTTPFIHRIHGAPFDFWRFTDAALIDLAKCAGFDYVVIKAIGGTPLLSAVALLYPVFQVPIIGVFFYLLAIFGDSILLHTSRLSKKGQLLIKSYPIAYFMCARKEL